MCVVISYHIISYHVEEANKDQSINQIADDSPWSVVTKTAQRTASRKNRNHAKNHLHSTFCLLTVLYLPRTFHVFSVCTLLLTTKSVPIAVLTCFSLEPEILPFFSSASMYKRNAMGIIRRLPHMRRCRCSMVMSLSSPVSKQNPY